jgi:hypothetical protein
MASYDFLDDIENSEEVLSSLTTSDSAYNHLLNDLNAYDVDAFVARGQLDVAEDNLIAALSDADTGDGIVSLIELIDLYAGGDGIIHTTDAPLLAAADTGDDLGGTPDGIISYSELLRLYDQQTYIVYSDQVDTADLAVKHTGPDTSLGLKNELLSFDNTLIGTLPGLSQEWYEIKNHASGGDGTVTAFSSSSGFADSRLKEVSVLAGEDIEHTGITHNEISQRKIVELLGVTDHEVATISTDILLSKAESGVRLIELGILDPIELATALYTETSDKINGLIDSANSLLDQDLPILGQSIGDLIGVELPGLDFDGFISGLASPIT